jgi:hypothetical protein
MLKENRKVNMQYDLYDSFDTKWVKTFSGDMTEEQKKILKKGLMSSEIIEDIGDRMEQEIKEVTNG